MLKLFKPNMLILVKFYETREITAVLLTASKIFSVGMHSDVYKSNLIKSGMMIDAVVLYILTVV